MTLLGNVLLHLLLDEAILLPSPLGLVVLEEMCLRSDTAAELCHDLPYATSAATKKLLPGIHPDLT